MQQSHGLFAIAKLLVEVANGHSYAVSAASQHVNYTVTGSQLVEFLYLLLNTVCGTKNGLRGTSLSI